eukprot:sb/3472923/
MTIRAAPAITPECCLPLPCSPLQPGSASTPPPPILVEPLFRVPFPAPYPDQVPFPALYPAREASRQMWNCTEGTRMRQNHRVPGDLFNEFINNWLMQSVSRPEFGLLRRNSLTLSQIRSTRYLKLFFNQQCGKTGRFPAPRRVEPKQTTLKKYCVFLND